MNLRLLIFILLVPGCLFGQSDMIDISLEESGKILKDKNYLLKITDKSLSLAKAERTELNSFWYPLLNVTGTYMYMSNDIEVRQSMRVFTDPAQKLLSTYFPDDKIISGLLSEIGSRSLSFPLMKRNLTSADANLAWPLFTGGKRIYASKLGKQMVNLAEVNRDEVTATVQAELVEVYYGVRLARRIVDVRRETYNTFRIHYNNALKFEQNGMMNKADMLFAKVTMDEAERELESAVMQETVAQAALKAMLNIKLTQSINPTSSLFIYEEVPSKDYFMSLVENSNYTMNKLDIRIRMAKNEKMMSKSSYFPMLSVIGKHTFYSDNIPKYLMPRSMIGVALTWNIFDGLGREAKVRQAKIGQDMLMLEKKKARNDLSVLVDELYSRMMNALDDVSALNSSMQLSDELLRVRIKSFQEGMATSTEVIDARNLRSKIEIAFLMAYYQYDIALASLLSVCGVPDSFWKYCNNGKKENYIFSSK